MWYGSSTIIPPSRGLDWESGTGVVRLVRRGSGLLSKLERLPVFRLAWWNKQTKIQVEILLKTSRARQACQDNQEMLMILG